MTLEKRDQVWSTLLNSAQLLWFVGIPLLIMLIAGFATLNVETFDPWLAPVTLTLTASAWLIPLLLIAFLTRRHTEWHTSATLATTLLVIAGYVLLDATLRALLPERRSLLALIRLLLLFPYLILAAIWAPRLAKRPSRSLFAWLGIGQLDLQTLFLTVTLTALLTLGWPLTGALGDRFVTINLLFQTIAAFSPLVILIWGLVFTLLTTTFPQRWQAALITLLLYNTYILHGLLPRGDLTALLRASVALPLALLLTELRARTQNILPLILLGGCYISAPQLFTDPRDVQLSGIPEMAHILSGASHWMLLWLAGLGLWLSRWLFNTPRQPLRIPTWIWKVTSGALASSLCLVWLGSYLIMGRPGFYDDGFLIIMEEQTTFADDLTHLPRETRLTTVYDTLTTTAERTQAPIRAELDKRRLPYRPYYIINMIHVEGHQRQMRHFADLPGVAKVMRNPNVRDYPLRIPLATNVMANEAPSGLQVNLAAINTAAAWDLGITGENIVIAGQDSGYEWEHPALKSHYRGWDGLSANHTYNWYDAWDNKPSPYADDGHGTHTMGTMLGDDGINNQTGVAPGAQWIGCRNMRRGLGNPGAYAACMEYFLAPYPLGGDPFSDGDVRQAPHVINNSWGCPLEEGCATDTLEPAVNALRAAGIMMVVSAGNDGPNCATTSTPPANYDAAYSVGATDNSGRVTNFSSRGPVGPLLKPDIAAPGLNVRSSLPDGQYGLASGTSMAGPHVTGLVALLWSANPALIGDIDATEALICQTATPRLVNAACNSTSPASECACGDIEAPPNNVYGCGIINIEAAVKVALEK